MTDEARSPRAVLAAGAPLAPAALSLLRADAVGVALRVGVDGGARHFRALGLRPHAITGDFDSLTADELRAWEAEGVLLVPTPDQEYTDLDKGLEWAVGERGARTVRVHGAIGGRLDHTVAALSATVKHGARADVRLVDEVGEVWWARPGVAHAFEGDDLPGRTLSLLALGPCAGVTLTGARWPLRGESLAPGVRDGTSNEVTARRVTLRVEAGTLLVQLHHAPAG